MLGAMGVLLMPIRGFETSVFPSRCAGSESHAHTGKGHSELQVKRKWRFADLGRPPAAQAGNPEGYTKAKGENSSDLSLVPGEPNSCNLLG